MARPSKPPKERRENVLRIRLTDAERAELDAAAQGSGLETSTWARYELLGIAKKATAKRKVPLASADRIP